MSLNAVHLWQEVNCPYSSQEETCTIKSTNRRGNFSAKRYECKMAGCLFHQLLYIRPSAFTYSLGGHMVPVPNCLCSVPYSQGWDLTQVRCSARIWKYLVGRFLFITFLFFFLQRYQDSEYFPDQDWPHQAGRLWPCKEAWLWVFNGGDCKLRFPCQYHL